MEDKGHKLDHGDTGISTVTVRNQGKLHPPLTLGHAQHTQGAPQENTLKTPRASKELTYLSTFYHKLTHTAQKHVFSLTVFLVPTKAQGQLGWVVVYTQSLLESFSEWRNKREPSKKAEAGFT